MSRKYLFFDIDGTIMGTKRFIPDSTKLALKRAKERGNLSFICTGRSFAMLPSEILDLDFDGYICAGGTYIRIREKELIDFRLTTEQIGRILSLIAEEKLGLFIEGRDYLYHLPFEFYEDKKATKIFLKELTSNQRELDFNKLSEVSASKFSGIINPHQWEHSMKMAEKLGDFMSLIIHRRPNLEEYKEALKRKEHQKDTENVLHSSGFGFIEMLPKGFNKATGIAAVLKEFGAKNEDAYGFGDSENDREMLSFLKNSICMGNGSPEMKKIASYVTSSLKEDGLYKAMEHFSLI